MQLSILAVIFALLVHMDSALGLSVFVIHAKLGLVASIALKGDESIFTSGDYERFFQYEGKRYPHIIDPRTGYPANQATSVTVLHSNASIADAAATALFVAGDDWPTIAAAMNIDRVMLIRPDGQIELSPLMEDRVRLIGNTKPAIIRTERLSAKDVNQP